MRTRRTAVLSALLGLARPLAAQSPVLVSPAGPGETLAAASCPTFSWGTPAPGKTLEILVFAIGQDGKPAARPAIRQPIPAGATAWTPSADRCLAAGRYAWTVRSGDDEAGAQPAVFRVAEDSGVRIRKLEELVARLTASAVAPAPTASSADLETPFDSAAQPPLSTARASELRWLAGAAFSPPACGAPDVFSDVNSGNPLCPWIEQLYTDGITQGCGGGKYCPKNPVTREQLSVFLGKIHHADAGGDLTGTYPGPTLKSAFRLPQACSNGDYASWNGSTWNCSTPAGGGDITAVNAGNAMTGGGTNGDVTIGAAVPFHIQANGGHWGEIAGPGIGGTGDTGVVGWGNTGVFGYGNGTGVWGETGLSSGVGVRGNAWAGGLGVYGYSGGSNYGVRGDSVSGRGVSGYASATSGATFGVVGETASGLGVGVLGASSTRSGLTNAFVGSTGVWGDSGASNGVFGTSVSGRGVTGYATAGTGSTVGVEGEVASLGGSGVRGVQNGGAGLGSTATAGVFGDSWNGPGVVGHGRGIGVAGSAVDIGVYGNAYWGVEGVGSNTGGWFRGDTYGVYIDTGGCTGCAVSAPPIEARHLPEHALIATASGAHLTSGGTWVNASDASLKENFSDVDRDELLQRVSSLPIRSWNYIADGAAIRHVGPTAQDFQAVFQLGGGDTTISTIDPAGIALAAIQELTRRTEELQREVVSLRRENHKLSRLIAAER